MCRKKLDEFGVCPNKSNHLCEWSGQGEPNKDFVVTLLIMDEDGTIHPITAFKKNLEEHINENETKIEEILGSIKEIPVDIKFNPGSCDKESDILEKVKIKNV